MPCPLSARSSPRHRIHAASSALYHLSIAFLKLLDYSFLARTNRCRVRPHACVPTHTHTPTRAHTHKEADSAGYTRTSQPRGANAAGGVRRAAGHPATDHRTSHSARCKTTGGVGGTAGHPPAEHTENHKKWCETAAGVGGTAGHPPGGHAPSHNKLV